MKEEPELPPAPEPALEAPRVPEDLLRARTPIDVSPRVFVGPDLFNPPAHQGWITLTPSFTLSAEYNDNIFLEPTRRSDVILGFTPGVTLTMRRPEYRIRAGYNISGELFLREDELSNFGKEQRLFADVFYQISPRLTFGLNESFVFSRDSNTITSSGVSAGRQDAWRNTITPYLRWQATQTTGVSLVASHTILRLDEDDEQNSDTYRIGLGVDRQLTARLTAGVDFGIAYFDVRDQPDAWTYTPTLRLTYDVTPTLRAWVSGGPSVIDREGDITVSPAVAAGLTQIFKLGSVELGYDRAVTADTVGVTDRHAIFASLVIPTLLRGLYFNFTPRYSIVDTDVSGGGDGDIKTLTLNLGATYQIVRNISLIGSYTFFHEKFAGNNREIDQNRVFLGVQYAFPINFY